MKTLKNVSMAVVLLSSMALLSCKEKTVETEETNVEMASDTTDTTGQPVPDTVPGVVSGAGDEQVP